MHVPVTRVSEIVNEHRGITADTALRLARHFGTSADFWMNIQKDYELTLARQRSLKAIEKQVRRRIVAASGESSEGAALIRWSADHLF
jgi:plasmid maintenance system antidote protein VapI